MSTKYMIVTTTPRVCDLYSGKRTEDEKLYNVEPSEGGGIEGEFFSLVEAENYIKSVGGEIEYIL